MDPPSRSPEDLARAVRGLADLRAEGVSRPQLKAALTSGSVVRVRRGWYATTYAHPDVVAGVRVGGALTGASAAALYGLWVPPDERLHVSVARNASRLRLPDEGRPGVGAPCIHWRRNPGQIQRSIEAIPVVLQQALECMSEEMAIVLIDSALHNGTSGLTRRNLQREFEFLPARYRRALARADGRSESGIETLVRLRLRRRGVIVKTQFRHPGVGRVDLLVGERLVIEVDGREHHDTEEAFASDRERDLVLFRDGFERLRLTYRHVMFGWAAVEEIILDAIRRRQHRWRAMDRPKSLPMAAPIQERGR